MEENKKAKEEKLRLEKKSGLEFSCSDLKPEPDPFVEN